MTDQQVLKWREGLGWLVLSGEPDALGDIRAQALSRMQREGHITYVGTSEDDYDDYMEDMGELGAPTGFLVNVLQEDDDTIHTTLSQSGMVVLPGDQPVAELKSVLAGPGMLGLEEAYERGALILAEAEAAKLFGMLLVDLADNVIEGVGWVQDALLLPTEGSIAQSNIARALLTTNRIQAAIGLGEGSALVLGPENQVETWGDRVTIALGGSIGSEN